MSLAEGAVAAGERAAGELAGVGSAGERESRLPPATHPDIPPAIAGGASAADDLAEAKAEAEVDPAAAAFVAKDVAALRAQQAAGELQDR